MWNYRVATRTTLKRNVLKVHGNVPMQWSKNLVPAIVPAPGKGQTGEILKEQESCHIPAAPRALSSAEPVLRWVHVEELWGVHAGIVLPLLRPALRKGSWAELPLGSLLCPLAAAML